MDAILNALPLLPLTLIIGLVVVFIPTFWYAQRIKPKEKG